MEHTRSCRRPFSINWWLEWLRRIFRAFEEASAICRQIPHFANALVRDDNPMSCGAALASADEASIPRWFEVAGREVGGTPALEPGRAGTPVPQRAFLLAGRRAGNRAVR